MQLEFLYELFLKNSVVCTDTRKLTKGCLFFALKGDNFNGNKFAQLAIDSGAAFAIIDEAAFKVSDKCILVNNVLQTLQDLATLHRKKLNIPVIAIVGSNGKTTTKELINNVLITHFSVLSTPGNFNNHIGLPLTLLMLNNSHQIAVIEMGANHVGENEFLCQIALPTHGLITNNGKDHLEGFGSLEGVVKSNSELYYYLLKNNGHAFVNAKDAVLMRMAQRLTVKTTYAANFINNITQANLEGFASTLQPNINFTVNNFTITSKLSGDYNFDNIMAAVAIGLHFGLNLEQIAKGIESYEPKNLRSQIIETDSNKIFLDAYNANPSSMEVSIRNFAAMPNNPKVLILGDMYELGSFASEEHQNLVDYCKNLGLENVILVGEEFFKTNCTYQKLKDVKLLTEQLINNKPTSSFIFIKGSRGMKLEQLTEYL